MEKKYKYLWVLLILAVVGCTNNSGDDCDDSDLTLTVSGNDSATCESGATVTLTAQGGSSPYSYSFDGSAFDTKAAFDNVAIGGPYEAVVRDANGCEFNLSVNVSGDENTVNMTTETEPSGCGGSAGSIVVTATGGDGSYDFKLGSGDFSSNNSFAGLEAGTYEITARDGSGCVQVKGIRVLTGISYKSSVEPIINASCAVSGCHVGGTGLPNFTSFTAVQTNASSIKTRVLNRSMPRNGTLAQSEIDAIVCWVDDGAQNN